FFFFFQAEDGIRDLIVTGVQTCALPISRFLEESAEFAQRFEPHLPLALCFTQLNPICAEPLQVLFQRDRAAPVVGRLDPLVALRSEERRVGKECRCRWWACHCRKNNEEV